jgi:hypothetical protein
MPFDAGSPQFGINDGKIATWVAPIAAGPTTYTPAAGTDIMSIQMGQVTMELISAILTGDDQQTSISASAIGGSVQVRWGGLNLSSLAVLTGNTIIALSSTAKQVQIVGGQKMPFVGMILKALSAEVGDTWLWLPKCKIMSGFTLAQMEYGAFVIPEVTMQVIDDASWGAINIITHVVDTPILAFPPGNLAPARP